MDCKTCVFFVVSGAYPSEGKCHRYPPSVVPEIQGNIMDGGFLYAATYYPTVQSNWWCGEHSTYTTLVSLVDEL